MGGATPFFLIGATLAHSPPIPETYPRAAASFHAPIYQSIHCSVVRRLEDTKCVHGVVLDAVGGNSGASRES